MNKLLPPVLFLVTVAALALIAWQSHNVHQKAAQVTQATIQQQQSTIQIAKTQLEQVQRVRSSPEYSATKAPNTATPVKPNIRIAVPGTSTPEKTAEITKRIESAHQALAAPAASTSTPAAQTAAGNAQTIDLYMPIVVTGVIGLAALYIILSKKFEAESLKWAYGILGTIVGFWLKSQ
jgi:Tfp pilus assembly protein PilV